MPSLNNKQQTILVETKVGGGQYFAEIFNMRIFQGKDAKALILNEKKTSKVVMLWISDDFLQWFFQITWKKKSKSS